jgi:FkbM family methyltransferase
MNSKIYYLIHSNSFGDTLSSTPTLRYLSKSHGEKINVVTHNKNVFNNNPYVKSLLSFEEFQNQNLSNIVKYESFTHAGRKDGNGIEKKFSHIDTRQLHSMDLGFQLLPENMEYDFYPNPQSLSLDLPEKYVVLHITSNWANRTWSYNNWVNLIKWLKDNQIFTVLIGAGYREKLHHSYSDKPLDKECPMFDDYYGLDLTNKGSMSDMWWVIDGSQCLITMDSGPLHLAGTTDVEIIQLGSAINPKFRAPYRNGRQDYKYHYLGGTCDLFCNSNLFYNVKEWGNINSVPPQPNCAENKPTFECHPTIDDVINSVKSVLNFQYENKYDTLFELLISDDSRINFNFKKTLNKTVRIDAIDVLTGLKRDKWIGKCERLDEGNYWWVPSPGRLENLGNIYLKFYFDDEYFGELLMEYSGGKFFIINNKEYYFDNLNDYNYSTFWEIFIHNEYQFEGKSVVDKNDIVLDIGANFGFFTLYAIENGASKIYSVEPFPDAYENIKNLSEKLPIIPINKAVSSKTDNVIMSLNTGGSASNCLSEYNTIFNNNGEHIVVEPININTLIESIGSNIDLLKIDCEGSELDIFESITTENLNKIRKMVIETHSDYIDTFIKNKLFENNFEVKTKKGVVRGESENILFVTNSTILL